MDDIEPKIADIKKIVSQEYQVRKKEIQAIAQKDKLGESINNLNKGKAFSFSKIMEIVAEGSFRYANQIPPGYMDAHTKSGIRQYGDLIVWKEMIRYAKENAKDLIYICNDVKPDWVIVDETNKCASVEKPSPAELGKPRRELLSEFEEETGQRIWMYKTSNFIDKIEKTYQPVNLVLELHGKLGAARDVLYQKERERQLKRDHNGDTLLVRCDTCGELFEVDPIDFGFNWENSSFDERGMGCEVEYESYENCECPNCGRQIELNLQIWESPIGMVNYQNIDVDGGEIESSVDLSKYIIFDNFDTCACCGGLAALNDSGLCESCEEEISEHLNSDD